MFNSFVHGKLLPLSAFPAAIVAAAADAVHAQKFAYAPYSRFGVGACLIHLDGTRTTGCNYENCTLQACCAERCAIVKANSEGRRQAVAVAVYGSSLDHPYVAGPSTNGSEGEKESGSVDGGPRADDYLCPPCGLCRQLLVEVADLSGNYDDGFSVILVSRDTKRAMVVPLRELIPMKFGPSDIA